MANGHKWNVGALNNVWIQSHMVHTTHQKTNCWTWNCILHHQFYAKASCKSTKPQNGLTFVNMFYKGFHFCFRQGIICTCLFIHTHKRRSPKDFTINSIRTSHVYKYVITCASSCMSKAPSPFDSMFVSWESSLPMLIWDTSSEHPNMVHKYVKMCHLSIASKSTPLCQQASIGSFSLQLGLQINPSTSQLTLPTLWTMSKSYSCKIWNAHLINFPIRLFNSIKFQRLMICNQHKWATIKITFE
jgi:hypothetical protein